MGAAGQPDAVKLAWSDFRRPALSRGYAQAWGNQRDLVAEPEPFFRKMDYWCVFREVKTACRLFEITIECAFNFLNFQSYIRILNFRIRNNKQRISPPKQGSIMVNVLSTINHETELWYCLKQLLNLENRFYWRMTSWMNRTSGNVMT